ncbi:MAG TPA: rhodanese-like domain-containing protein [Roseimicrobium sp.]|nr:rhodanese-like domain-containing protein [Roseimicrobium sp.]
MTTATITADSKMSDVLEAYPGAQRALFRKYHVGGCASCGFQPTETLSQVCTRNGNLDVTEVLSHIQSSHELDTKILIEPKELVDLLAKDKTVRLVDVRSREEYEAVNITGSILLSQPVMREIMSDGTNSRPVVIVDHQGKQALDAAAYFIGHGLTEVYCLKGGIDAWSLDVDPQLPRYRLS